jgi:hypothetical protein
MLYVFFWVIPRRLNFICQRFETLCLFHLHRQVGAYLPMKMEQTECSETSAYKIQTPGNYPEENIQHTALTLHPPNSTKYCLLPLLTYRNLLPYRLLLFHSHTSKSTPANFQYIRERKHTLYLTLNKHSSEMTRILLIWSSRPLWRGLAIRFLHSKHKNINLYWKPRPIFYLVRNLSRPT